MSLTKITAERGRVQRIRHHLRLGIRQEGANLRKYGKALEAWAIVPSAKEEKDLLESLNDFKKGRFTTVKPGESIMAALDKE